MWYSTEHLLGIFGNGAALFSSLSIPNADRTLKCAHTDNTVRML